MPIDIDKLEALHAATTTGEWRTIADSFNPPEHFIVSGDGVFGSEQIAGPSAAMTVNADYDFIAASHNELPAILSELRLLREFERLVRNADDSGQRDAEFVAADAEAAIRWLDEQRKAVRDDPSK